MPPTNAGSDLKQVNIETLREVVEKLAPLDRTPCSAGEREAAEWIANRLESAGARAVRLDRERSWGTFPPTLTALGLFGVLGSLLTLRGRRVRGALMAGATLAGLVDEIQNGPRILRRAVRRARETTNVIAEIGDSEAERTLVMLAHHDAAQTGFVFDQSWARYMHKRYPQIMEASKNQPPQWWLGVAAPLLTIRAALSPRMKGGRTALALGALGTLVMGDILRNPTVPGANDNLSAVAALVGLAEAVKDEPLEGIRILLVSAGAEETFQDGIRAFMSRHGGGLDPKRTWFLNFDTIGSTNLVMLEGEGPVWMEDYTDPGFRDLVASEAENAGVALERGIRARASSDGVIPSRAGYPTATLVSIMPWRLPGNYHLMTDLPENLDYESVAGAVRIGLAVARALSPS